MGSEAARKALENQKEKKENNKICKTEELVGL